MSSLTALVAGLAGSVERAAVGSGAVPGDVAELAAGVALHSLSLAIAGKVVGTAALVASSGTGTTSKSTTAEAANETTAAHGGTTAHVGADRVRTCALVLVLASDEYQGARVDIQQGDQAGHSCSTGRWCQYRSGGE